MSKVEMSLQEYNELHEKVLFLEGLVDKFVTPEIDTWDINYFLDNEERKLSLKSAKNFSSREMKYLEIRFYTNLCDVYREMKDTSTVFDICNHTICIAEMKHNKKEENLEEASDNEEVLCCDAMND